MVGNYFWEVGVQTIFLSFLMTFCLGFYQFSIMKIYPFSNRTKNEFYFKGEMELTSVAPVWRLAGGRGERGHVARREHYHVDVLFVLWNFSPWYLKMAMLVGLSCWDCEEGAKPQSSQGDRYRRGAPTKMIRVFQ